MKLNDLVGSASDQITFLLQSWGEGDEQAYEQLVPMVYEELRRMARRQMSGESTEHTLQTTALVHEAYLRLVKCQQVKWQDRTHFFCMAARLMRRVLVEYARSKMFQKRGAGAARIYIDSDAIPAPLRECDLVALDDALQALASVYPRKSQVIELRFFGGLSVEEAAESLQISPITAHRDWQFAKAWLARELGRENRNDSRTKRKN